MKPENGTIISHYRILSKIGKGGMGEVFLAQDTELDRKVAIKFLSEEFSRDSDKLKRFIQEAKATSALNHPNILTVHQIGEANGTRFIATEFIEGETLRGVISRRDLISLDQILNIGIQVAEALSAAHNAGIIHRDIKPENIMVRRDGYVKVLDFGLAKLTEKNRSEDNVSHDEETRALVKTIPGVVMGTVSYMSPEQARGKETDTRTDIWSLGVVLYEMLAGAVPFSGETINHTIVSILENKSKPLENVPDELQRMIRKTLAKEVEMRYQTARDLLIDLKNLRRALDIEGELDRSTVPNKVVTANQVPINETTIYDSTPIEETKAGSGAAATQNVTNSSSLEYAVIRAGTRKFGAAIISLILLSIIPVIIYFGVFTKSANQINSNTVVPIENENDNKEVENSSDGKTEIIVKSIAVMPFENESKNEEAQYLSDEMTEMLIKSMSNLRELNVIPLSTVIRYKGSNAPLITIGKELNVEAILTGRVRQHGEKSTLFLELVDVNHDKVLWTESYQRRQSDLVSLQSEIAAAVNTVLTVRQVDTILKEINLP